LLHLTVLIENMRREGYELMVGPPKVIEKHVDGQRSWWIEIAACPVGRHRFRRPPGGSQDSHAAPTPSGA
jgi:predicted membrane GTPase involved in stress response